MGYDIEIIDVTPRDGLQNESTLVSTELKVELVGRGVAAGARRVEVTSFVNPKRVPQLADADQLMDALDVGDDVSTIGLALNERGAIRAIEAGVSEINYVHVATDAFSVRNQGTDVAGSLAALAAIATMARAGGRRFTVTVAAAFGCPFEGDVTVEALRAVVAPVLEIGVDELALADTIGVGVPADVVRRVAMARDLDADVPLRFHFHDTRRTGVANALAAVDAGVTTLDATAGGIGGCPFAPNATGNVAIEDVVYALERSGYTTNIDLDLAIDNAGWVGSALGIRPPGAVARAGRFPTS